MFSLHHRQRQSYPEPEHHRQTNHYAQTQPYAPPQLHPYTQTQPQTYPQHQEASFHHERPQSHAHLPPRSRPRKRMFHNPCFSGLSGAVFTLNFIFLCAAMFLMEGPILFLNVIYSLYLLIMAVFVITILLDLAMWDGTKSGSYGTRRLMSWLCPLVCLLLSLPPVGLLWHIKNRGGFSSPQANVSLVSSIIVAAVEALHLLLTFCVYRRRAKMDDTSVRFAYAENSSIGYPSPASSIRSGRVDFVNNRSRGSLASIDPAFVGDDYASIHSHSQQRASAVEINRRFCEQQGVPVDGNPIYDFPCHSQPASSKQNRNRHRRRNSDSSIMSETMSYVSQGSRYSNASGKSDRKGRVSVDDTMSVTSHGSKKSSSSKGKRSIRVEEELTYNPGYFMPAVIKR